MSHNANDLSSGAGRFWQTLLSLDRQAGELTDRTAAYAFDDEGQTPWVATGLVERLVEAMSGRGDFRPTPGRAASPQPFSAVSSPGAN